MNLFNNFKIPHSHNVMLALRCLLSTFAITQFTIKLFIGRFLTFKTSLMVAFLMLVGASVRGQVIYDWGGSNCMTPEAGVIGKSCTKEFLWNCPVALTCDPYSHQISCTNCNSADYEVGNTTLTDVLNGVGKVNIKFKTPGTKHIVVGWTCWGGSSAASVDVDIYEQTYTGGTRINGLQSGIALGQAVPVCRTGQMDLTTTFTPSCGSAVGQIKLNKLEANGWVSVGTATLPMGTVTRNINTLFSNLTIGSYEVLLRVNEGVSYTTLDNSYFNLHDFTTQLNLTQNTSFCNNTPTTLSANASGGWSQLYVYRWSNGATTANINVPQSGTYTVTVTDGAGAGCAATQSITVASVAPTLTIVNSNGLCVGSGGTLTATTNINLGSYRWNINNATTQTVPITQSGIYTVTVTDSNNCTRTASITIGEGCCKDGYTTIGSTPSSITTINQLYNNGTIPNSWVSGGVVTVPHTTLLKWVINGKLIIDMPLRVSNFDFKMCENAIIENTTEFKITTAGQASSFKAVNDKMWEGIKVRSGAKFLVYANAGKVYIEDAITGIEVDNNGTLTLDGSSSTNNGRIFLSKNLIGIKLNPSTDNNPTIIKSVSINGGGLKQPYLTFNSAIGIQAVSRNKPIEASAIGIGYLRIGIKSDNSTINILDNYSSFLYIDNINTPPSFTEEPTAIFLENNSNLNIDWTGGGWGLYFQYNIRGIYADNSNVKINNSVMLRSYTAQSTIGIDATNSNVRISNLGMLMPTGVAFKNGDGKTLSIQNSQIDASIGTAISLYQNNNCNITIQDNLSTAANTNLGIRCLSTVSGSFGPSAITINHLSAQRNKIRIKNNTISANKSYGVYMNSVVADAPTGPTNNANFTVVEGNNISFADATVLYKKAGIGAENSKYVFMQNNIINGINLTDNSLWGTAPTTGAGNGYPAAIQIVGTQNATLCGNTTDNVRTGILFNGTCSGSKMTLNNINKHQTGIYYRPNVMLGEQLDGGNTFLSGHNYTDAGARNMAVTPSNTPGQIKVNPSGTRVGNLFWTTKQKTTTANIQNWFATTTTTSPTPPCANTPTLANLTYDEQIADGLINTNEFPVEMEWWAKKNLYEDLSKQTNSQNSAILQNFKDSIEYTPTGELTDVKNDAVALFTPSETYKLQCTNYETQLTAQKEAISAIYANIEADSANANIYEAQIQQANALFEMTNVAYENLQATQKAFQNQSADNLKAQNAVIQPILLQEFNQKAVNEAYFSTVAKGESIQPVNGRAQNFIPILEQIAAQCPYTGGPAVYEARSLLANHTTTDYDDQAICAIQGINYKQSKPKPKTTAQGDFKANFMPNPASTQVLLQVQNDKKIQGNFMLIDALGRTVLSRVYNGNTHQILSLDDIANGMYFIQFVSDINEVTHLGKLSVVK